MESQFRMHCPTLPTEISCGLQVIITPNTFPDDTHSPAGVFKSQGIGSHKRALTVVTTQPRLAGKGCPLPRSCTLMIGPENSHPTEVTWKAYVSQDTPVVRVCRRAPFHL